ncbi:mechanosensitive ion channel protein MscS [Sulfolobus acidocaldarius SUSAZ]|nr:mechanosensitive ion channel protein MscS [Sulfolobus acidocaldarius SUSAZ]
MNPAKTLIRAIIILLVVGFVVYILHVVISGFVAQNQTLAPYARDIELGVDAALVGIGGYIIIRIIKYVIEGYIFSKTDKTGLRSISLIVDLILYTLLILAILSALGVNLTGAAIGGAVGGVAIGLAAQTVASNVLSGILVTSSRTVRPGDSVILESWIWSPPIIGEVERVSILFTEVRTNTGNLVKVPNSAFLGNTVFTKLEDGGVLTYPYQLTVSADVSANQLLERVSGILEDEFKKENSLVPDVIFYSKNGVTNIFLVSIKVMKISKLNEYIDIVNKAFDKAYWELKNLPQTK